MMKNAAMCLMAATCAIVIGEVASAAPPTAGRELRLEPRVKPLPLDVRGWLLRRLDGSLLNVADNQARASHDGGKTWTKLGPIADEHGPTNPRGAPAAGMLLRTGGAIVLVYHDLANIRWKWDAKTNQPRKNSRLDVWAVRSLDDGKTWVDRQRLLKGYCGALIDIIETSSGNIVVPVQRLLYNPGRHATATYVSTDQGKTWSESNVIDIGGHGHHDGAYEATLVERRDGRLWMLLRTNHDCFYQAFSADGGLTWNSIGPSSIDASSSPGHLVRLANGRLALAWNRLYAEGKTEAPRRSGAYSATPGSWHREELSIAFSEDDGQTWSKPAVIARNPGARLSYPNIFEARPGELWTYVGQGEVWMQCGGPGLADSWRACFTPLLPGRFRLRRCLGKDSSTSRVIGLDCKKSRCI